MTLDEVIKLQTMTANQMQDEMKRKALAEGNHNDR